MPCPSRVSTRDARHGHGTRSAGGAAALFVIVALAGCNQGPPMAPVTGKVLYNDKPLEFGSVTFQPPSGQPAQGDIQKDGTFVLSTYRPNDGAVVGVHKVRIACYESQRNPAGTAPGEQSLGRLLIPRKYTLFDQSGLVAEIHEDQNEPLVFELSGPSGP